MMIVAIDTATQYAGLALYNSDGVFAEEMWCSDRNHTTELSARIRRMLKLAGLKVADLTALAVAIGPGSFTGLRIGLAVAKGMALPHKLPLVGVPTLDIVAYPLRAGGMPVWAVVQAGRKRILAARYELVKKKWQVVAEPQLTDFEKLAKLIKKPALCIGEIDEQAVQILQLGSRKRAKVVSPAARVRRAGHLAEIAAARIKAGHIDDPDSLVPVYISTP